MKMLPRNLYHLVEEFQSLLETSHQLYQTDRFGNSLILYFVNLDPLHWKTKAIIHFHYAPLLTVVVTDHYCFLIEATQDETWP